MLFLQSLIMLLYDKSLNYIKKLYAKSAYQERFERAVKAILTNSISEYILFGNTDEVSVKTLTNTTLHKEHHIREQKS